MGRRSKNKSLPEARENTSDQDGIGWERGVSFCTNHITKYNKTKPIPEYQFDTQLKIALDYD